MFVPSTERTETGGVTTTTRLEPGPALRMKRLRFPEGALRFEVVDHDHEVHPWDEGGVFWQWLPLGGDHALRIVVRVGRNESLDGFRRDHGHAKLSAEEPMTVCGRPARRLVASHPEEHITCIEYADGRPSSPGYHPAETTVVVAFEHRDLGVTATWRVPTDMRRQYRALEDRFFASITCD